MKKVATRTLLLVSLLVGGWLGATWWVGVQTEQFVRENLTGEIPSENAHKLVSYQRKLFGAQIITRLDVKETPLGAWTDAVYLRHDIQHGPFVWKSLSTDRVQDSSLWDKFHPALSHWQTSLAKNHTDKDIRLLLKSVFNGKLPVSARGLLSYQQILTYQAELAAFNVETESGVVMQSEDVLFSGKMDWQNRHNDTLTAEVNSLVLQDDLSRLQLPTAKLRLQTGTANTEHTLHFSTEQATVNLAAGTEPFSFAAQGTTTYATLADDVNILFELALDIAASPHHALQKAQINIALHGLNASGLEQANQRQNRLQDIQAQLRWNAEETAMPEARREQVQLGLQLEQATVELLQTFFEQTLQRNTTQLRWDAQIQTEAGDLQQSADLVYTGNNPPLSLDDLVGYKLANWAQLMRGEIKLDTTKAILPDNAHLMLDYPLETRAILEKDGQYQMNLQLTEHDIELNGRVWAHDHLVEKFIPRTQRVKHNTGPIISAQVMAMIEERGLSDDVLQELEANQDVSAEALKMLRQLQFINQQLD